MREAPGWLPALTLHLQLQGLAALGLDSERVRAHLGPLPDMATAPDAMAPVRTDLALWEAAERPYGMPGMPSALAHTIPFGAFGALDDLVASADTVIGCCESARLHFAMVALDVALEVDALDDGGHLLRVRARAALPGVSERSLQRRLTERGLSFTEVVEAFRREEATRLLAVPGLSRLSGLRGAGGRSGRVGLKAWPTPRWPDRRVPFLRASDQPRRVRLKNSIVRPQARWAEASS
jgi:AraC-like DNA-binding protein